LRGVFALLVKVLILLLTLGLLSVSIASSQETVTCQDNVVATTLNTQYTLCIGRNLLTGPATSPHYKIRFPSVSGDGTKASLEIRNEQWDIVRYWPLIDAGSNVESNGIRITINRIVPSGQDSYVVFTPTLVGTTTTNNLITIPIGRCSSLGFNQCEKLTGLYIYNYTTQGTTTSEFTLTLPSDSPGYSESPLDERLISCTNISNVTIGFYNYTSASWTPIESALVNRRLVTRVNFLGTFAIIKKPDCVPKECGPYGYYLIPPEGFVPVNNPLKFVICGFLPGCQPAEPGCSRACPQDIDPQCPTCTKASGNCCVPKLDGECDLDCAPGVDPDCASSFTLGEINCDEDGTCNLNCPNSTTFKVTTTGLLNRNFMWYADVDCCRQYGSQISSNTGDCCKAVCDGICDGDCIVGQDPDCTYECPYCGDGKLNDVQYHERVNTINPNGYQYESCIECSQDCPGGANQYAYEFRGGNDGGNAVGEAPGGTEGGVAGAGSGGTNGGGGGPGGSI